MSQRMETDKKRAVDAELTPTPALPQEGEGARGLFGRELIIVDDSSQWVAWEAAQTAWLESKRRRSGRDNTVNTYKTAVRQFFEFAQCPPWEVSPLIAQEWVLDMDAQGLAKSTVNVKLAAMSSLYDFVQRRYVAMTPDGRTVSLWPADRVNPFNTVERVKVSPYGRAEYPSVDELKAILSQINTSCLTGKRDFALLFTIATTCRRFSEIVNLKWGDLRELEEGDFAFSYIYKGGEEREAVLPKTCYQAICAYLAEDGRPPEEMAEGDYVFVALYPERIKRMDPEREVNPNQPISNRTANRVLKKYARRVDVDEEKAHVHGLRHAGLRLRVQQMKEKRGGVDYIEIMELAGHSSLAVTQIYVQQVLEDPEDPGGAEAAQELLPKGARRRRKKPAGEQMALEGLEDARPPAGTEA